MGFNLSVFSQGNFELQNGIRDKIHFKLVNNLIVIPVTINGVSLSFLLDTGGSDALWLFLIPPQFKKRKSIR
jgi:hypothetical protein